MVKEGGKEHRKATAKLIMELAKSSSAAVRKGANGQSDAAKAIRALQNERRLTKEELNRAATV